MPGKYSHSVVLADYSSRGIINLPNDQHVAYLRSSPYQSSQYSRASSRARSDRSPAVQQRSRSALDFTNNFGSGSAGIASPGRRIIIDATIEHSNHETLGPRYMRPSSAGGAYIQPSATHQATQQPDQSFYTKATTPRAPNRPTALSVPRSTESQRTALPARDDKVEKVKAKDLLREISGPSYKSQSSHSTPVNLVTAPVSPSRQRAKLQPAIEIVSKSPALHSPSVPRAPTTVLNLSDIHPAMRHQASQETQIHAPVSRLNEPDFDGFSDVAELDLSYFGREPSSVSNLPTKPTSPVVQNKFGTSSPRIAPARAAGSRARTHRSMSTEPSDSEVLADVGDSPLYTHMKLDSLTSVSSNGSKGVTSVGRGARTSDTKKSSHAPLHQDWRLPEIDEDVAFDPDFFTQGPEDFMPPTQSSESIDSFLDRPLGTVSAGRDVDFTNDNRDADSEADVACPPDIGRFRNGDEFGTPSYLQPKKKDSLVGRVISAPSQMPKTKKMGFLSRFRPKSRQQE